MSLLEEIPSLIKSVYQNKCFPASIAVVSKRQV